MSVITTWGETSTSPLTNIATITGRNLRRLIRVPTLIVFATLQPVLFVVLFTYGFGGAVHPPGVGHYIDYLLPGIFILSIGFGASQTGVSVAEDLANGMFDRFRSLPIAGSAYIVGRVAADAIRNLFVVGVIVGFASMLGFRFHGAPAAVVGAVVLAVAVGVAFSATNVLFGLLVKDAESAGLVGLFPVIILAFTSSTFVPVSTMPGWLQPFAKVNPITVTVDALRALCLGHASARPALEAGAWILVILIVTLPFAAIRYRRASIA